MAHCNQCGYDWSPKLKDSEPVVCTRCKRYDYREQKKGVKGGNQDVDGGRGGAGASVPVERKRDDAGLPVVRGSKSPAKRLRTVQPVLGKLAERGESGQEPEDRAVQGDGGVVAKDFSACRCLGHMVFKRSGVDWCATCSKK